MQYFNKKWPGLLLWPFSVLYGLVMELRNILYDRDILQRVTVDVPVISVGNITVGGTGKTPTVAFLAQWLADHKVCVLSRGYGRKSKGTVIVSDGSDIKVSVQEAGDEPYLLARRLKGVPVIVDEDRARGARTAVRIFNPDAIILDDGFQHRRLRRNLDVVTLNGTNPFGNQFVLPAGPLREFKKNLNRAHLLWINHSDRQAFQKSELPKPVVHAYYTPVKIIDARGQEFAPDLTDKEIVAFTGLASPENFKQTLLNLGASIKYFKKFDDHHTYIEKDIVNLERIFIDSKADALMTTEKDWVKLFPLLDKDPKWQYLVVEIVPEHIKDIVAAFSESGLSNLLIAPKSVSK